MSDNSVTAATDASRGPVSAPVPTEMDWSAMITPIMVVDAPMVAEVPTFHHTFIVTVAGLSMVTVAPTAVVRVVPIWKTHTAFGSP